MMHRGCHQRSRHSQGVVGRLLGAPFFFRRSSSFFRTHARRCTAPKRNRGVHQHARCRPFHSRLLRWPRSLPLRRRDACLPSIAELLLRRGVRSVAAAGLALTAGSAEHAFRGPLSSGGRA
ncbi:hypothetical protein MTO96_020947 [Rhipicephalus appendiculatus]